MSEPTTEQLIDEVIKYNGGERGAIAYLIGSNDSSERYYNRACEIFNAPKRKTTIEWLTERINTERTAPKDAGECDD